MKTIIPRTALLRMSIPVLLMALPGMASVVLVSHAFDGEGAPLNGVSADTFHAGITTAGGSDTWAASGNYSDNGTITVAANAEGSAFLNMGSYINDARGTATGLFNLSVTMTAISGSNSTNAWRGLSFFKPNTPDTNEHFTRGDSAGKGTIIYRGNGDLNAWAGPGTSNSAGSGLSVSGPQELLIVLDLTPAGGYDGLDNFGTISFFTGATQIGNSITYLAERDFGSIGLSNSGVETTSSVSNLLLTQIPEPGTLVLVGIALGSLLLFRRRR